MGRQTIGRSTPLWTWWIRVPLGKWSSLEFLGEARYFVFEKGPMHISSVEPHIASKRTFQTWGYKPVASLPKCKRALLTSPGSMLQILSFSEVLRCCLFSPRAVQVNDLSKRTEQKVLDWLYELTYDLWSPLSVENGTQKVPKKSNSMAEGRDDGSALQLLNMEHFEKWFFLWDMLCPDHNPKVDKLAGTPPVQVC